MTINMEDLLGELLKGASGGSTTAVPGTSQGGGLADILGGFVNAGQQDSGANEGAGGGLGDVLGSILGGGAGKSTGPGASPDLISTLAPIIMAFIASGGLEKLLAGFQKQGLGDEAASWVGTGPNAAISGEEVRKALSPDELASVARQLGMDQDEAAATLATVIPGVVNAATPDGLVPSADELARRFGG